MRSLTHLYSMLSSMCVLHVLYRPCVSDREGLLSLAGIATMFSRHGRIGRFRVGAYRHLRHPCGRSIELGHQRQ